jgi:hypothetical protein
VCVPVCNFCTAMHEQGMGQCLRAEVIGRTVRDPAVQAFAMFGLDPSREVKDIGTLHCVQPADLQPGLLQEQGGGNRRASRLSTDLDLRTSPLFDLSTLPVIQWLGAIGSVSSRLCQLLTAVRLAVFCVVTPCRLVGRYQRTGETASASALKMETDCSSETLVFL